MRFPNSSLLCRQSLLLRKWDAQRVSITHTQPASSLSAIHNGLRQSQKSRPQGFNPSSLTTSGPRIKKGKKLIDDKPEKPSRRARFHDPKFSFGKKSMVYQMQHGALKDALERIDGTSRRSSDNGATASDRWSNILHADTKKSNGFSRENRDRKGPGSRRASSRSPSDQFTSESFMEEMYADENSSRGSSRQFDDRKRAGGTRSFGRSSGRSSSERGESNSFAGDLFADADESRGSKHQTRDRTRDDSTRPFSRSSGDRFSREKDDFFEKSKTPTNSSTETNAKKRNELFSPRPIGDRFSHEKNESSTKSKPDIRSRRPPSDSPSQQENKMNVFRSVLSDVSMDPAESETSADDTEVSQGSSYVPDSWGHDGNPIRIPRTTAASQFLYGRSAVEAALRSSRRRLYKLYIYDGTGRQNDSGDATLEKLAKQNGIEVVKVSNRNLRLMDKMSEGRPHNGCVLEASPVKQLPLKALGELTTDKPGFSIELDYQSKEDQLINGTSDFVSHAQLANGRKPMVLLLDGILDPGNLGAILRTAAFLGIQNVAITKHSSASLTPVALKASSGASETLNLFSILSPVDFLTRSQQNGWLVYVAAPSKKTPRGNKHLTVDRVETYDPLSQEPTILVVGSEGKGISKQARRTADYEVTIPNLSEPSDVDIDSLNVSVATGILCAAFVKNSRAGVTTLEQKQAQADLW